MDILELNEVLLSGERQTISMIAEKGIVTTLTGGSPERLSLYLKAILGFVDIANGHICIDGEPLTIYTASFFRSQVAYAPSRLEPVGEIVRYDPPSVQDVFSLKSNQSIAISNGILAEEMRKITTASDDERLQLIAVAALLGKNILLIDNPPLVAMTYLNQLAEKGRIVVVTSNNTDVLAVSHKIVEI